MALSTFKNLTRIKLTNNGLNDEGLSFLLSKLYEKKDGEEVETHYDAYDR